jgi:urea transport system permease protein
MADMYFLVTTVLVICFVACFALVHTKFGKILTAIRDNENRVLALGYNTAMYKTFIFAIAGALAGLAGALFVSAYGTTGPDSLGIAWSIEVVVWVAAGGRGTLVGAVLGAVLVGLANTYFNDKYSEAWPIILGSLFIGVVLLLPEGILGGLRTAGRRLVSLLRAWKERGIRGQTATTKTLPVADKSNTNTTHAGQPKSHDIQAIVGDVKGA